MHSLFSQEYIERIPQDILNVRERILEKHGIPVEVREMTSQDVGTDLANAPTAAMFINPVENSMTILVQVGKVQPSSIAHELIHLERYFLDDVPMLWSNGYASAYDIRFIQEVENNVEHLFVVPREIEKCSGSAAWWADHYKVLLSKHRDEFLLRMHFVFLQVVLPDHEELNSECSKLLHEISPEKLREAKYFSDNIKNAMPNKREVLRLFKQILHPELQARVTVAQYQIVDKKFGLNELGWRF